MGFHLPFHLPIVGSLTGEEPPPPPPPPRNPQRRNRGQGMSLSKEGEDEVPQRRRLSCTVYFDALWFCYSPVHQMQQYYRLGNLDNCSKKFGDLFDCLNLKRKRTHEVEEILETREKAKVHIWSFRSPEEAASNWNEQYGHLDDEVN